MIFFTSDEHYGHAKIIQYCNRPFANIADHDEYLIRKHNEVVHEEDTVYHLGDFSLKYNPLDVQKNIKKLNGVHIFLQGSHDQWAKNLPDILNIKVYDTSITLCHYAMKVWNASHYGTWQLFGHSHGKLVVDGKQLDVGVDCNNYAPFSFMRIQELMVNKPENFNFIPIEQRRKKSA